MRIAIVSTLTRPVPPVAEGSVELLVSHLTEYLVAQGHDVTLFALPESKTTAQLVSPVESSYVGDPLKWDWQLYEAFQVKEAFARWQDFDVINCHSYYHGLMHADAIPTPSIHSFHVDPGPDYLFLAQRTKNRHLHFCSHYQARDFQDLPGVHVIPHGIDVDAYAGTLQPAQPPYLAWMGRFHPDKGVLEAISIAKQARIPLKLAAPSSEYFREVIQPAMDGADVEYVGELSGTAKTDFLRNAFALLYPVERGEPFGLVLIEAMAAGLPVLAYNKGAVPEVIEQGVTGYFGDVADDLLRALEKVPALDRARIQSEARRRFSLETMGSCMEQLMLEVTARHG